MTRDEIMKLEGKNLDASIAVLVMGWELDGDASGDYWEKSRYDHIDFLEWKPSENIAHAWQVVEKFYSAHINRFGGSNGGKYYDVYMVTEIDGKNADGQVTDTTAPLAISRAALLAVLT